MTDKNKNNSSSVVPTRWNYKFGKRLTDRRKKFNMYQSDFARKTGIGLRTIQSYEKGKIPTGRYLTLLAKELDCKVGWLLEGEGPEPDSPRQKPEPSKPSPIYKVEDHPDRVAAPEEQYDPHGGWKPRPEMQDQDHNMLGKAFEIIRSNTIYRPALLANINAFHAAMTTEKKLDKTEKQLDNTMKILEDQADTIRQMGLRLAALEKKNEQAEKDVAAG